MGNTVDTTPTAPLSERIRKWSEFNREKDLISKKKQEEHDEARLREKAKEVLNDLHDQCERARNNELTITYELVSNCNEIVDAVQRLVGPDVKITSFRDHGDCFITAQAHN